MRYYYERKLFLKAEAVCLMLYSIHIIVVYVGNFQYTPLFRSTTMNILHLVMMNSKKCTS
jgi:hypothetical protein